MIGKTCLLISDDPDDHIEFSEALYEISNDIILVTVTHPNKALDLLKMKKCNPDFVFINLEMNGFAADDFFTAVEEDPELENIDVIAFGEYGDYDKLKTRRISSFMNNGTSFSELRNFLQKVVNPT
jgi:two-component SAPR family response regulator